MAKSASMAIEKRRKSSMKRINGVSANVSLMSEGSSRKCSYLAAKKMAAWRNV